MQITEIIKRRQWAVTCELDSPKGASLEEFLDRVEGVRGHVDAIHIGDNQRAVMRAASLAVCHVLRERDLETVMELAALYRNRLALQSDLLGAAILGVENLLLTEGFDPTIGDHADAHRVHDLSSLELLKSAVKLTRGTDLAGHPLTDAPAFCLGVAVTLTPEMDPARLEELKEKVAAGASYIQTQPLYQPEILEEFLESIRDLSVPVIVGHLMLKSASMARFVKSNLPGVSVPEEMIRELEGLSRDRVAEKSMQTSVKLLRKMKPLCQGVHLIPAGWERYVPGIVEEIAGEGRGGNLRSA